ncbi:MAG: branched-chain amino acid ABC transporter permease [Candidatus Rokubacteria bacterium]|nr:branched-chain amino acid ABC transporter permease [Candidatus Rokubacteria bacterium]
MDIFAQLVLGALNGLVWGFILALIALGLTLVFGLLEIINISHGELYMLGAVLGWYVLQFTGNFWVALILAPLAVGVLGLVIERGVLRPIEGKPIITIIATFGLSLIFQQAVLTGFGGAPQRIPAPFEWDLTILGFGYSGYRFFVALCSIVAISALWGFLRRFKYGMWMRAVRQDREMSLALGIPISRVYMLTFGLGSGLAALGGILAAPIVALEFRMGLDILPAVFIVVIIGGLGSLEGSLLAALLIGELEGLTSVFVTPTTARIFSLVFMSAVLLFRPEGLLGRRR